MALGISTKSRDYVLEDDREKPEEMQTRFFIKQKTLDDENEIGIYYSDIYQGKGRRGQQKPSKGKANLADIKAFGVFVTRVENFFVPVSESPEINSYDPSAHFAAKEEAMSITRVKIGDDIIGYEEYFKIPVIEGQDLKYVAVCLDATSRLELADASEDLSKMSGFEKKG